jgi:hypothetical protein
MKTTTTINAIYPLPHAPVALAALGGAIKTRLLRLFAEKPVDEKALGQALNTAGKSEHYWQQITTGSSR